MNLTEAIAMRDAAKAAYTDALQARSVGYGDKTVSRQDIRDLRNEMDRWEQVVSDLSRASMGRVNAAIATWMTR